MVTCDECGIQCRDPIIVTRAGRRVGPCCSPECIERQMLRMSVGSKPATTAIVGHIVRRLATDGPADIADLCIMTGVAHATIRRIMRHLENERIVYRDRLRGPWVLMQRGERWKGFRAV